MRWLFLSACLLSAGSGSGQPAPAFHGESLNYNLNWPSGLSLGEAQIGASRAAPGKWEFLLKLDASLPAFPIVDRYRSVAENDFCSVELEKETQHGARKGKEKTTFDSQSGTATRTTVNGGKSEFKIPACARDAVAFLYHLRRELASGRIPPAQTVYFGAAYNVRFEYGGVQNVRVGEERIEADRVKVTVKGPAASHGFEVFFQRDALRTPVLARIPAALGIFSLELAR
jgi:hypothetical protein